MTTVHHNAIADPSYIPPIVARMLGKKFNKWTVVSYGGWVSGARNHRVVAQCECGTVKESQAAHIWFGQSKDCGCGRKATVGRIFRKHGLSADRHPLVAVYASMLTRCYNPRNQNYPWYGGSGVTVCDRWRCGEDGRTGIECFVKDMGDRPTLKHTIDRKNGGIYEPSNCCWATMKEQCGPGKRRKYGSVVTALGIRKKWGRVA